MIAMIREHSRALAAGATGAVIIAFSAILVRLADVAPAVAAFYRCAYALPLLGVLALREIRQAGAPDTRQIAYAAGAGLCFAIDLVCWHVSIAAVGAGLATVLANMQVVLIGLVALLVPGQRITAREVAAIPLVMAGVVLIAGLFGTPVWGAHPELGAITGLMTACAYTGFLLLLRAASPAGHAQVSTLLIATAVAAAGSLIAAAFDARATLGFSWPAHGWLLLLAVTSQVFAWLLITRALSRLRPVETSLLLTIQPVGSVLLGIVLLGEAPHAAQLAGAALIILSIIMAMSARPHEPGTPVE